MKMTRLTNLLRVLLICLSVLFINACNQHYNTGIQDIHGTLNEGIENNVYLAKRQKHKVYIPRLADEMLQAPASLNEIESVSVNHQNRFDIDAESIPAKAFFMGLIKDSKRNIVVRSNDQSKITMHLSNVTIEEALQAVQDAYGYQFRQTTYGYEVVPPELMTRTFHVDYLAVKRSGLSKLRAASSQISDKVGTGTTQTVATPETGDTISGSGSMVESRFENNFWANLEVTLKSILTEGQGRTITVNPQAGVIVVRAFPVELKHISNYLKRIQKSLQRQVILEAKVLEVELSDSFQAGIDWTLLGLSQAGSNFTSTSFKTFLTLEGNAAHGDFTTVVRLLEQQGNVQVLSSPRISTVNNQQAIIKVGSDEFFVTGVTSNLVPSGTGTTTSQSVDLTPFFSGITLDVTPEISDEGDIVLHIHPSVSTIEDQTKDVNFGSSGVLTLPLAKSTIRESDTIVHARNNQVVVIGGLMQNSTREELSGTPFLSKLPYVGSVFRTTTQTSVKSELVILLRPVLVDDNTWTNALSASREKFREYDRGFHAGSRSEVFGMRGETSDRYNYAPASHKRIYKN